MKLFTIEFRAMGSPCTIRLYGTSPADAQRRAASGIARVNELEQKYSRYRHDSLISEINRSAGQGRKLISDDETCALLNYAQQAWQQSEGLFDPTSGVLRKAWDFRSNSIPSKEQILALMPAVGWQKLGWNGESLALVEGAELDFGGFVKEYAADAAVTCLRECGVHFGVVELGGDIAVIGPQTSGQPWPLAVRVPEHVRSPGKKLRLAAGAFTTSGDYERCLVHKGERFSHILNPLTGWPVKTPASVSVVADNCIVAGTASTVAMLCGEANCIAWLESLGLPFYCIFQDGRTVGTF